MPNFTEFHQRKCKKIHCQFCFLYSCWCNKYWKTLTFPFECKTDGKTVGSHLKVRYPNTVTVFIPFVWASWWITKWVREPFLSKLFINKSSTLNKGNHYKNTVIVVRYDKNIKMLVVTDLKGLVWTFQLKYSNL